MYATGNVVSQDDKTAVKWWKLAAEQGYAISQKNLGWMYENGRGVSQDYGTAVKWYKLSAKQGDAGAQHNLGRMYENGLGVSKNYKTAVEWYKLVAEQGHAPAQDKIEELQQKFSEQIPSSTVTAEKSAPPRTKGNYWKGQVAYRNQDYATALREWEPLANQGNANALFNLGVMYKYGQGVPQNYKTAIKWFRLAAKQGHPRAQEQVEFLRKK
jgi:hypothetical protein